MTEYIHTYADGTHSCTIDNITFRYSDEGIVDILTFYGIDLFKLFKNVAEKLSALNHGADVKVKFRLDHQTIDADRVKYTIEFVNVEKDFTRHNKSL